MLKRLEFIKNMVENSNSDKIFYSCYYLDKESQKKMKNWMEFNKIPDPTPIEELHCTLIYSKIRPIDYTPSKIPIVVDLSKVSFKHLGRLSPEVTVILLPKVPALTQRYELAKSKGAISDFPSYIPHITISNKVFDFEDLTQPDFMITLDQETIRYS